MSMQQLYDRKQPRKRAETTSNNDNKQQQSKINIDNSNNNKNINNKNKKERRRVRRSALDPIRRRTLCPGNDRDIIGIQMRISIYHTALCFFDVKA